MQDIGHTAIQDITDPAKDTDIRPLDGIVVIRQHLGILQVGTFGELGFADPVGFHILGQGETDGSPALTELGHAITPIVKLFGRFLCQNRTGIN